MNIVLCANPESGGGDDAPEDVADALRRGGATVVVRRIDELEREGAAIVGRAERLVVAGGDGSIGLAAAAAADAGVPLAVIATGTANDFARALDLPADIDAACALAADPAAPTRQLDLALADGRPFVNAASAGLAPHAARKAKPYKKLLGPLAYALGAAQAGVTAQPLAVAVTVDGEAAFDGGAWQLVVGNTGAFGGGSSTGAADPADGAIDVAVVPAGSRLTLVRRARAMRAGRLVHQDDVAHARGARVEVRPAGKGNGLMAFNIDGEICRLPAPATFTVHPGAFALVVPGA